MRLELSHTVSSAEPAPRDAAAVSRDLGDVERVLMASIGQLARDEQEARRSGPGRPRILPAFCLWAGLLVCVARGFSSQQALWRLLTQHGLWWYPRFPVTDRAIAHRLARAGTEPLEQVFRQITRLLALRLVPDRRLAPFATEVVALDATTLDPVARLLPSLRGQPTDDCLPGKLHALFDVRLQQWRAILYRKDAHENDKVVARDLAMTLPAKSLILADLGYFGFAWFDELTDAGYHWISRLRQKTSTELIHVFYEQGTTLDALVWLGAYRADRSRHAVRLLRFVVGTTTYTYVTNVTDPWHLSMLEVAQLYARRWDIELGFKLIKRELGLHLLWSPQPTLVLQQVWAVLIISQILQALRFEVATRAGVELFEVSMPLLVEYLPRFAAEGKDPIATFVEEGWGAKFIRPSRRVRIEAPEIPIDDLVPLSEGLVVERTPRYAQPRSVPRERSELRPVTA